MESQKTENELIAEISSANSEVLAAHVVVYRSLGINKKLAIACMSELASRRKSGDDFNYEEYIENKLATIPQLRNLDLIKVTQEIQKQVRSLNVRRTINTNDSKDSG